MLDLPLDLPPWLASAALLALLPFALAATTAYAKISVVLTLLRRALGLDEAPPTSVLTALAILLSAFIMAPVLRDTLDLLQPLLDTPPGAPQPTLDQLLTAARPWLDWINLHAATPERDTFAYLANLLHHQPVDPLSPLVAVPAFLLTELREAFTIGLLLFLPFLVIDLVVSATLTSLGLNALAPHAVSAPFKLLLFVLIDGWTLLAQGLILGYIPQQ